MKKLVTRSYPVTNGWFEMPPFGPEGNVYKSAAICTSRRGNLVRANVLMEHLPTFGSFVDVSAVNANDALMLATEMRMADGVLSSVRLDYRVASITETEIVLESHFSILGAIRTARNVALSDVSTAVIGRQGIRRSKISERDPHRDLVFEAMDAAERALVAKGIATKARETSECIFVKKGVRLDLRRFREGWRLKGFQRQQGPTSIKIKVPEGAASAMSAAGLAA